MQQPSPPPPAAAPESLGLAEPLSVYLHLPFCRERCPYCDFFVLVDPKGAASARLAPFVALLERELELALAAWPELRGAPVATLYLGGGTPSLFAPETLAPLFARLRAAFAFAPDAEVTMEANPTTFLAERLPGYIDLGINRLSLGVQTLDADALRLLGRAHTAEQSLAALEAARTAALCSYSADLIFGYPGQTAADLESFFRRLVEEHGVPHVSAYALTLHAGTPLQRRHADGLLTMPEDGDVAEMFRLLRRLGGELGLPPYEISNFARPGHQSRHNTAYWRLAPVLALGPSACGYLARRRVDNPRSWEEWAGPLERGVLPWRWEEPLEGRARSGEMLMCALRRGEGATWEWLEARGAGDLEAIYAAEFAAAEEHGWLTRNASGLRLTEEGVLWSDEFFATLF